MVSSSTLLGPSYREKGTPKGSLVTPLLGLLIIHIIFMGKIKGALISQIWELCFMNSQAK